MNIHEIQFFEGIETQVIKEIEGIFNRYPKAAVIFYRRLGSIFSKRISRALEGTQ